MDLLCTGFLSIKLFRDNWVNYDFPVVSCDYSLKETENDGKVVKIFMLHSNFFHHQNDLDNVTEMVRTLEHAEVPLDTMTQFVHG